MSVSTSRDRFWEVEVFEEGKQTVVKVDELEVSWDCDSRTEAIAG
jgi:hypothetical protein